MSTWTDPPVERGARASEPSPSLTRIIEVLFPPCEPDPELDYYGPCDKAEAPEAGS
jgi:hypothetical protein